jgi:hypothetical protein
MPVIDFSDVKGLEPIPDDRYRLEIASAKEGLAESGYEKIDLQCKVMKGKYENRVVFETLSWHPNAMPFTKKKLIGLGFDPDFAGDVGADDLVGRVFEADVKIEPSRGVDDNGDPYPDRNKITRFYPIDVDPDDLV